MLKKCFTFSHLEDKHLNPHVIFIYFGEDVESEITITLSLNEKDGTEFIDLILQDGNTSYDFNDLWINTDYYYSVKKGTDVLGNGSFKLIENGFILDGLIVNKENKKSLAAVNSYQAKSGTTNIGTATDSLWKAIENARSSSYSTATVVKNSSTVVFTKGATTTYHKYQFDDYYGSTTQLTDAQNWITGYNYSHIITNACVPMYDYLQNVKGGLTGISTNALIERNRGSYYFNFATSSTSYKKITVDIDCSSMTVHKASDSPYNNLYFFVGAKQSYTFEVGLIMGGKQSDAITLYPYYMIGDGVIRTQFSNPMVVGTINSSTGIISFSGTVRLSLGIAAKQMICKAENITTSKSWSETIDASLVSGTASTRYFYCASLVPDKTAVAINDLRNYAFMKNAKLSNPTLYTTTSATAGTSMAPTTAISEFAFLYNTDCGTYSSSSGIETVSLFYDRGL